MSNAPRSSVTLGTNYGRGTPYLNIMIRAAQKAGRSMIRDFGEVEKLQVARKSLGDFVSKTDLRAEKILIEELQTAYPDYNFLTEESGEIPGKPGAPCWVIDPLDGTTNFLHSIPHFCISIALQKGTEIIAGVIYNPILDEMYYAEKGFGAFMNKNRLRVSGRSDLDAAVIAIGTPHGGRQDNDLLPTLNRMIPQVAGIRRMGAAALDMAYVAAGRFEGYFERALRPWDIAAGIILVQEAGGTVTDIDGGQEMLTKNSLIATNHNLSKDLRQLIMGA